MDEKTFMTEEGYQKTVERLNFLKTTKRQEVANKIAEARSYGDLSENSEYDIAREEQASVEAEIFDLENKLKTAEIIDSKKINTSKVGVGCTVEVLDIEFNEKMTLRIMGSIESDPTIGQISNESPTGKALIGKAKGDLVEVSTPAGTLKYQVLSISY